MCQTVLTFSLSFGVFKTLNQNYPNLNKIGKRQAPENKQQFRFHIFQAGVMQQ